METCTTYQQCKDQTQGQRSCGRPIPRGVQDPGSSNRGCMEPWATWCSTRSGGWWPCLWQGGWNLMILGVPSNPSHWVILWFDGGEASWSRWMSLLNLSVISYKALSWTAASNRDLYSPALHPGLNTVQKCSESEWNLLFLEPILFGYGYSRCSYNKTCLKMTDNLEEDCHKSWVCDGVEGSGIWIQTST